MSPNVPQVVLDTGTEAPVNPMSPRVGQHFRRI